MKSTPKTLIRVVGSEKWLGLFELYDRLDADETVCLEELLKVDLDKVDWNCPASQQKTYTDRIAIIKHYLSLPWTSKRVLSRPACLTPSNITRNATLEEIS